MALKTTLRVMAVDDMSVSRALIQQSLDEIGFANVVYDKDGASALRQIIASPVHLVLSDYNMPGMDGLGLLEGLRGNRTTQKTGFILITGRADREVLMRGQALGMNNFVVKPFTTAQLRGAIEKVVGPLG